MSEKVTVKEVQVVAPVVGQILTVIECETGLAVEIKLTDVWRHSDGHQVSGDVVAEQKVMRENGKEHVFEVDEYFEAISAYGKYWSIYEPHSMSGNDSRPIRTLVGHEEVAVISKTEGLIDYDRTR